MTARARPAWRAPPTHRAACRGTLQPFRPRPPRAASWWPPSGHRAGRAARCCWAAASRTASVILGAPPCLGGGWRGVGVGGALLARGQQGTPGRRSRLSQQQRWGAGRGGRAEAPGCSTCEAHAPTVGAAPTSPGRATLARRRSQALARAAAASLLQHLHAQQADGLAVVLAAFASDAARGDVCAAIAALLQVRAAGRPGLHSSCAWSAGLCSTPCRAPAG
jgi:hypothetical protein